MIEEFAFAKKATFSCVEFVIETRKENSTELAMNNQTKRGPFPLST
jgi:hypothetical protein